MSDQLGGHNSPSYNQRDTSAGLNAQHDTTFSILDLDLSSGAGPTEQDWDRTVDVAWGAFDITDDYNLPPIQDDDSTPSASQDDQSAVILEASELTEDQSIPAPTSVLFACPSVDAPQQQQSATPACNSTVPFDRSQTPKRTVVEPLGSFFSLWHKGNTEYDAIFGSEHTPSATGAANQEQPHLPLQQPSEGSMDPQPASDHVRDHHLTHQSPSQQEQFPTYPPQSTRDAQYYQRDSADVQQQPKASATARTSQAAHFQALAQGSSDARDHIQCLRNERSAGNMHERAQFPPPPTQRRSIQSSSRYSGVRNGLMTQQANPTFQQPEVSPYNNYNPSETSYPWQSASSGVFHPSAVTGRASVRRSANTPIYPTNADVPPAPSKSRPSTPFTASLSRTAVSPMNYRTNSMPRSAVNGSGMGPARGSGPKTQPANFGMLPPRNSNVQRDRPRKTSPTMTMFSDIAATADLSPAQNEATASHATSHNHFQVADPTTIPHNAGLFLPGGSNTPAQTMLNTARAKTESASMRKPRKPKTGQKVEAASDQLLVQDFDHAQSLAIKRRPLIIEKDDRDEVAPYPDIWIPLITKALDTASQQQPDKADEYTREALIEWTRWQQEHEAKCWDILASEPDAKVYAQACAWHLFHAVLEAHRGGQGPREVNGTLANGGANPSLKCSERLRATIRGLEKFTIVRYDLLRLDRLEDFVASPQGFVDRKVNNMWTNYRKKPPHVSPKIAEAGNAATAAPTAAKGRSAQGKRKVVEVDDVAGEDGDTATTDMTGHKKPKKAQQPQDRATATNARMPSFFHSSSETTARGSSMAPPPMYPAPKPVAPGYGAELELPRGATDGSSSLGGGEFPDVEGMNHNGGF